MASLKRRRTASPGPDEPARELPPAPVEALEPAQEAASIYALPPDLLLQLFLLLDAPSLLTASAVSRAWHSVIAGHDCTLWKSLCARDFSLRMDLTSRAWALGPARRSGSAHGPPLLGAASPMHPAPAPPLQHTRTSQSLLSRPPPCAYVNWKAVYGTHLNLARNKFRFHSVMDNHCLKGTSSLSMASHLTRPDSEKHALHSARPLPPTLGSLAPRGGVARARLHSTGSPLANLAHSHVGPLHTPPLPAGDAPGAEWPLGAFAEHVLEAPGPTHASRDGPVTLPASAETNSPPAAQANAASPKIRIKYVSVWPTNPDDALLLVLDAPWMCWVQRDSGKPDGVTVSPTQTSVIYVQDLDQDFHLAVSKGKTKHAARPLSVYEDICPGPRAGSQPVGIRVLTGHEAPVKLILSNKEGKLVSHDAKDVIFVWDLASGKELQRINVENAHGSHIMALHAHRDHIISAGLNGQIYIWDIQSGAILHSLQVPTEYLSSLESEFALNVCLYDRLAVFGLYDGTFHVFHIPLPTPGASPTRLQASARSSVKAAPLERKSLLSLKPQLLWTLGQSEVAEHGLTFAPSSMSMTGQFLLTNGGYPDELSVWNLDHWKQEIPGRETWRKVWAEEQAELGGQGAPPPRAPARPAPKGSRPLITRPVVPEDWDYLDKEGNILRYTLSETIALQKLGLCVPPFRDIKCAELTSDATCILSSVQFAGSVCLFIWDFRVEKRWDRWFVKRMLNPAPFSPDPPGELFEYWLVYDVVVE